MDKYPATWTSAKDNEPVSPTSIAGETESVGTERIAESKVSGNTTPTPKPKAKKPKLAYIEN
jgi:hypothetical protein